MSIEKLREKYIQEEKEKFMKVFNDYTEGRLTDDELGKQLGSLLQKLVYKHNK